MKLIVRVRPRSLLGLATLLLPFLRGSFAQGPLAVGPLVQSPIGPLAAAGFNQQLWQSQLQLQPQAVSHAQEENQEQALLQGQSQLLQGLGQGFPQSLPQVQLMTARVAPSPAAMPMMTSAAAGGLIENDRGASCMAACEEKEKTAAHGGMLDGCRASKVVLRQDHAGNGGLAVADATAIYGGSTLTQIQRSLVVLTRVADTSFQCLDDRIAEPSLATPGGDLGEFILGLTSYLQERDPTSSVRPTQEVVDTLLEKYLETIPASRPMIHCTDDRAINHLESELPIENLNLDAPPEQAKKAGLLNMLTEVENQGDSHIRLMLKQPEWFQLSEYLVPMVLKAFYTQLWRQNQDPSSPFHKNPKLRLHVLVGESDPQAFIEVSSGELCNSRGVAPMLTPHLGRRSVLVSHLDAVSLRREELATFFARIANTTPRKIDRERLHQRLDRHGWLALETTGSRIAAGLPFYALTYM